MLKEYDALNTIYRSQQYEELDLRPVLPDFSSKMSK